MKEGFESEITFWRDYLPKDTSLKKDPKTYKHRFPDILLEAINKLENKPDVLELGPGPKSHLAWGVSEGIINVTAVDPLGDEYARILNELNIRYPIVPITGYGETLQNTIGDKSFDIIYSSNALDHTTSPKICVDNLVSSLKSGGIMYLEGYVNEGTHAKFTGLHQHDISLEGEHLVVTDKTGNTSPLTSNLPLSPLRVELTTFAQRFSVSNASGRQLDHYYIVMYEKL